MKMKIKDCVWGVRSEFEFITNEPVQVAKRVAG